MPKNISWRTKTCLVALAALFAAGCKAGGESAGARRDGKAPLRVVATTGMIGDIAARVGGKDASVTTLMGPGVDPHLYKATARDLDRLRSADLILYNGLHLEGKMGDIFSRLARRRPVVAVTRAIARDRLRIPPDGGGNPDPHVWMDVSLWALVPGTIAEAMAKAAPRAAAAYRARAKAVATRLRGLDRWVEEQIRRIPEGRRVLVTAHDAFGYFGRRYGIEVAGLQGISTVTRAGLKDVERIVALIVSRRIPAIFVETSVPTRTVEAVRRAVAARGFDVAIGGALYSDALGPAGTPAGTYEGMIRHNVATIVEGLTR